MVDKLREDLLREALAWATHAELRAGADILETKFGTVEDAILMCMFHLWASECLCED